MESLTGILAKFDSSISLIDTTTHYRYLLIPCLYTNYDRNIINQSCSSMVPMSYGEILFNNRKYVLRKGSLSKSAPIPAGDMVVTTFRKEKISTSA